jgi:hypothetical protein
MHRIALSTKGEIVAILFFVWVLNLAISFWNAYAVGTSWVESKHAGGWRRFIAWCGALMTDIGFTWCALILFGLIAHQGGWLTDDSTELLFNIGYVLIVPILLFAGYAITFDSWAKAYRAEQYKAAQRGVAGWNTFASIYNTYNAVNTLGDAVGKIFDELGKMSKNKDGAQLVLVLIILIFSFGLGSLITYWLINRYAARDEPMPTPQRVPA